MIDTEELLNRLYKRAEEGYYEDKPAFLFSKDKLKLMYDLGWIDKASYHLEKQKLEQRELMNKNLYDYENAPTEYGKYVDECLNEASKHFFSEGEDTYSVADLFYAGVRCGQSWLEKQGENHIVENNEMVKHTWSEEDETKLRQVEYACMKFYGGDCSHIGWLRKFTRPQNHWKPSNEQMMLERMTENVVDGICVSNGTECGASIESSAGMLFLQHNTLDVGDKVKIIIVRED